METGRTPLDRRTVAATLLILGGMAIAGCGQAKQKESGPTGTGGRPAVQAAAMTVYRDPSCGCCEAWADIARNAGYSVTLVDRPDMPAIKARLGVPETLASCHTAIIDGYAIEGHVPMDAVARLLKEKPKQVRGIAVAGMPRGSPGMEVPDGSKDAFQVMAFDVTGNSTIFKA